MFLSLRVKIKIGSALSFFLFFRFVTFLQGKPSKHKHGALVKEALAKRALPIIVQNLG